MIEYDKIELLRDKDGDVISNKENARRIAEYFLKELNYQAVLDVDNTLTSAHLLKHFGLAETSAVELPLTAKEKKEKSENEWKLIDLILYRINKEYKLRVSAKNLQYFAKKMRSKIEKGELLNGIKNKDYHMLYDLAGSGTSFVIKLASLFCKLVCTFHPDFGDGFRDNFVVTDFKRLAKTTENPQIDNANNAYIRYMKELDGWLQIQNSWLRTNGQISSDSDKLTITDMWLLELLW